LEILFGNLLPYVSHIERFTRSGTVALHKLGCQIPISKGSLLMLGFIYHSGEINAIEKFGKCQNLARIYTGLQKFTLGEYSFLHKESGEGFLLDYLGHKEFFKGDDLFGIKGGCHVPPLQIGEGVLPTWPFWFATAIIFIPFYSFELK
jgi:hypothetical protein